MSNGVTDRIREDIGEDVEIHDSSTPDAVFLTTSAKIENALMKYKQGVRSRKAWTQPFILCLTVLSALLVANFQSFLGLSKEIWEAIFLLSFVGSLVWLIYTIIAYLKNRQKAEIEYVIRQLKTGDGE